MIEINFKNSCLFLGIIFFIGSMCVIYRHWEIENYYKKSIKECLENPPDSINTDINNTEDTKLCDKACTLAPINTQISTINTRLSLLEKNSDKHDKEINSNTNNITKTTSRLQKLLDNIEDAKKGLKKSVAEGNSL